MRTSPGRDGCTEEGSRDLGVWRRHPPTLGYLQRGVIITDVIRHRFILIIGSFRYVYMVGLAQTSGVRRSWTVGCTQGKGIHMGNAIIQVEYLV